MDKTTSPLLTPWIARYRKVPHERVRLFCFPYAGGSAAFYRPWALALPDFVELCAIELPGRGRRFDEKPFTKLSELIETLVPLFENLQDLPFSFFGHSLGGLIAFELARALEKKSFLTPQNLLISASRAPHLHVQRIHRYHLFSDDALIEKIRQLGGTPAAVLDYPELLKLFLPTLRADLQMLETYACSDFSPVGCAIEVWGGEEDLEMTENDLKEWEKFTTKDFRVRLFSGGHFFIRTHQKKMIRLVEQMITVG